MQPYYIQLKALLSDIDGSCSVLDLARLASSAASSFLASILLYYMIISHVDVHIRTIHILFITNKNTIYIYIFRSFKDG